MKSTLLTGIFVLTGIFLNAQQVKSHYRIADTIHLDSNGSWDYTAVDEATNRLYVSHESMVQVVDLNTLKAIAIIPNTNGVHGIALADDLNKGFTSNGKDSSVTIFDLKTNATLANIMVTGEKPDAIVYDKVTQRVFTMNGKSSNATVIDAKKNKVIGTIKLTGKPEFCVADGTGKLFVNLEDSSAIEEIDAKKMKVLKHWSIAPGTSPTGLAIDTKNHRLFSTCDNNMMIISDAEKGKMIAKVGIDAEPDAAAFDPGKMRIYSSNGEGTLTVISDSADTYKVMETVETEHWARTMALNTKTHHIYLPRAQYEPLHPIRASVKKPKRRILKNTFVVLDLVPMN